MQDWLSRTSDGKFKIERIPCPHPGARVALGRPPAGVVHTSEGGWAGGMRVFRKHYAPHFFVGSRRIAQLVPLGFMASALENSAGPPETNLFARVQIEVQAYSRDEPYSFPVGVQDALASLLATLKVEQGIPLSRPYPDHMPPKPWATPTFSRRKDGKWGKTAGWFGHVEVPENAHWDPGALRWSDLLALAEQRLPKQPGKKKKPAPYWAILVTTSSGTKQFKAGSLPAFFAKHPKPVKAGWERVDAQWVVPS